MQIIWKHGNVIVGNVSLYHFFKWEVPLCHKIKQRIRYKLLWSLLDSNGQTANVKWPRNIKKWRLRLFLNTSCFPTTDMSLCLFNDSHIHSYLNRPHTAAEAQCAIYVCQTLPLAPIGNVALLWLCFWKQQINKHSRIGYHNVKGLPVVFWLHIWPWCPWSSLSGMKITHLSAFWNQNRWPTWIV